jgi:dTDP-4-dehydrorhamnose 3,5-epimerase
MAMNFIPTKLAGVVIVEPRIFKDSRGFFMETYHRDKFSAHGISTDLAQTNHSYSQKGTLRGLHFQEPHAQGKLVRTVVGTIFDVAVDIRKGSPQFGQWFGIELSGENSRQLWVPPGFAHGFCVLSDQAHMTYSCSDVYHPECNLGIAWNDPTLAIDWPLTNPLLSDQDQALPNLSDAPCLPQF